MKYPIPRTKNHLGEGQYIAQTSDGEWAIFHEEHHEFDWMIRTLTPEESIVLEAVDSYYRNSLKNLLAGS